MFAKPLAPWPPKKETITIRVDSDVLGWFKRQGTGYQTRMNQVLRRYMDVTGQQRVRHADQTRRKTSIRQKRTSKRVR
jgi:BrnA antitoxin of type II toxin-antitoxin system